MADREYSPLTDGFSYYVGGYETQDGRHFNMEAGDDPLTEDQLPYVDYVSVYIPEWDQWFHVDGPFEDWTDVEYDILDVLDEY